MAKSKSIVDYIESGLDDILREEYKTLSIKDIQKETRLPAWLITELLNYGYLNTENNNKEMLLILKTLMYCFNNHRFLKSAVGNISKKDKERLFKKNNNTRLRSWITTKVINLKEKGCTIKTKDIYDEICTYFPSIKEQGLKGYYDIQKYIKSAKRFYQRNKKGDK